MTFHTKHEQVRMVNMKDKPKCTLLHMGLFIPNTKRVRMVNMDENPNNVLFCTYTE